MAAPYRSDRAPARQQAFDDLGEPLHEVTFVVVDLETTGGSHRDADGITEIGAVKVRGGEVLGEFATLVDPGRSIPAQITILTGITNAMVYDAPRIESVLPSFLEFIRGCVLVAHNAPYDVGFLRSACARHGMVWPKPPVLDTVQLARKVLTRDEAPSVRLGALAPLLHATVTPNHRALSDAQATVDVLHALMERVGSLGVHSLPELIDVARDLTRPAPQRHLADRLPAAPGVYLFRGPARRGALRGHRHGPAAPGAVVLLRRRDQGPDQADGHPGRAGGPRAVRPSAGGQHPGAATDRRPPAAVQPRGPGNRPRSAGSPSPTRPSPG